MDYSIDIPYDINGWVLNIDIPLNRWIDIDMDIMDHLMGGSLINSHE